MRGKQEFCFGHVEFELPVRCSSKMSQQFKTVNPKLMEELVTGLSKWYLKLKKWMKSVWKLMWIKKRAKEEKLLAQKIREDYKLRQKEN